MKSLNKNKLPSVKVSKKCDVCQIVLKSEVYYKRHMDSKHPLKPQIYKCDYDGNF